MVAALAHVPVPTPVPVAIYKAALPRLLAAAPSLLKTAGGRSPLPDPPPFRPCSCFSPAPCRFGPAKSFSAPAFPRGIATHRSETHSPPIRLVLSGPFLEI